MAEVHAPRHHQHGLLTRGPASARVPGMPVPGGGMPVPGVAAGCARGRVRPWGPVLSVCGGGAGGGLPGHHRLPAYAHTPQTHQRP